MNEKIFFEHDSVKITNTRFIVDGQTFAMSNVTSVNALEQKPKQLPGVLILVVGLAALMQNAFFGLPVIALAIYYLYKQHTIYHLMLRTSGGETKALTTHQKQYLEKVISALNEAIIYRG